MGEAGDQCTVCFTGALQLHEGMLVCDVCGSVFQGFAEEAQEYQTGVSDARFFRKSEAMKSAGAGRAAAAEAEPPPPPPVAEAVRSYVRSLQRLLQRQARVMASELGVCALLPGVARELWLAHLAHTRLLEPSTIQKLEALVEQPDPAATATDAGPTESEAGGEGGGGGGGAAAMRGQMSFTHRRSFRVQTELGPLLSLRHTLALLLVAAWRCGEAVSPVDVARWALDGRLPYLAFAAEEGAGLEQYTSTLGRMLTSAKGVPSPRSLWQFASELAATLGAACPPLSPALWLQRYLAELQLPPQLLPVALQLHQLYQPAPLPPASTRARGPRHPWARLMAALVVAVKLCYGLDGSPRGMPGLPPPPAWPEWAPVQLARLGSLSAFPLTLDEAAQLEGPVLRAYLAYLRRGLLADCAPPPELQTIHRLFERLALPADPAAVAGQTGGGGGQAAGSGRGSGSEGSQGDPMALDSPHPQPEQRACNGQAGGAAEGGEGGAGEADSGGGGGGGGGPRAGYLFYAPGAASKALFHPDYVLLLAACAPLVWLAPEALHEAAAGLESLMVGAECEVSFLYHAEEQARLARLQEEAAWLREREAGQQGERRQAGQRPGGGRRRSRGGGGGGD